jgi:hypothetical protein
LVNVRKILIASILTALLLTACATQGKTTVTQTVSSPEPTEFVLPVSFTSLLKPIVGIDRAKETPTIKEEHVEEVKESPSVSPKLVSHMVANDLPETTAKKYVTYIISASDETGVDPIEILAVMHVETGGTFRFADHPNSHGAIGLMQILGRNAKSMGVTVDKLYDPELSILLGARHLRGLQDSFGHDLGITAYNWGSGNVSKGNYNQKYYNAVHKAFKLIGGNDSPNN